MGTYEPGYVVSEETTSYASTDVVLTSQVTAWSFVISCEQLGETSSQSPTHLRHQTASSSAPSRKFFICTYTGARHPAAEVGARRPATEGRGSAPCGGSWGSAPCNGGPGLGTLRRKSGLGALQRRAGAQRPAAEVGARHPATEGRSSACGSHAIFTEDVVKAPLRVIDKGFFRGGDQTVGVQKKTLAQRKSRGAHNPMEDVCSD
jgi:hypothetical protein